MTAIAHRRTVFVGNLDESVSEDLLRAAFIPFGDILTINIPYDSEGKHKGFGFIEYEAIEDANSALDNMNHAEICGKEITCSIAKPFASAKSKPVWDQQENTEEETKEGEPEGKVTESSIQANAPKRSKTEEKQSTTNQWQSASSVVPTGMVRCRDCGGFGRDFIQEGGLCMHCINVRTGKLSK